jgi:hypothetical protein
VNAAGREIAIATKEKRNACCHSRAHVGSYDHVTELLGKLTDEPTEDGDLDYSHLVACDFLDRCLLVG